jgi:glucose uptake protein
MILPGSYAFTVILLILSLLCWGLWATTFKLAGKWRYELYYFDFAIGMGIAALIAALTFGSMGWDGFSFLDDLRNAGKRQDLFAFLGGGVFNLGNVLMLASISLSGLSVGLPIGLGVALITGVIWNWVTHPGGNLVFLAAGCVAVAAGVILNAVGFRAYATAVRRQQASTQTGKSKAPKKDRGTKAVILGMAAGLLLGSFAPLLDLAKDTENGLGPYSIAVLISLGVIATTFVYSLFLMNLPVQGQPVDISEYFKGTARHHALGLAGGLLFAIGLVASLVANKAEGLAQAGIFLSYAMEHGAPVVGAICGIFAFKEFADGDSKFKSFLFLTLFLLITGITLVGLAPHFGTAA